MCISHNNTKKKKKTHLGLEKTRRVVLFDNTSFFLTTRRLYFLPARRHVFSAGKNDDSKTKEPGVLVRRGAEDDWTRTCGRRNRACKHTPGHANTHQGRPRTTTLQAEGTRTRPRTLHSKRSARALQTEGTQLPTRTTPATRTNPSDKRTNKRALSLYQFTCCCFFLLFWGS